MSKTLFLSALALSAGLFSASSAAQERELGFYARANFGQVGLGSRFLVDDSDSSFGLDIGWRFLPWLGIEAGYNDFGDYQTTCGGQVCPAIVYPRLQLESVELGLAARLPLSDNGVFAQSRLGTHRTDTYPGRTENDIYYGLGLGYQFNERFDLSLNFDRYQIANDDADRVGLGFEVKF